MPNYADPKTRQEKGKGKKQQSDFPYGQKRVRQMEALLVKASEKTRLEVRKNP
jgi:hypothetical protein